MKYKYSIHSVFTKYKQKINKNCFLIHFNSVISDSNKLESEVLNSQNHI